MSDDKLVPNSRSVQPPTAVVSQPQAAKLVQTPQQPISTPKEHAPAAPTPDIQLQEVPKSPEISQELKEVGVEQGVDAKEHDFPKELQQVGVQLAKESTPLTQPDPDTAKLPMSYAQAVQIQKTKGVKDSVKWLATFIMYQWKKLQQPKSQVQE